MNYKFLFKEKLKYVSAFFLFLSLLMGNKIMAQGTLTVSGVVLEAEGQVPLPGVNVIEKGTNNGTTTDFDGNYSIEVSGPNAVFLVSYIGFKTKEIEVNGSSLINVSLEEEFESLDEVVIIGYGQQRKQDLTGSVGSVDAESLTERNITSPLESMQGSIAGVQVSSSTGRIGDGFNISIRGQNTFGDATSPLFVVDGVPTDGIDFLNPQDIERIDVLKDASSTAIYGSRASNGVVIVTTKSGASSKGGFTVSFDSFVGIKSAARTPDFMSAEDWWTYHKSAYLNGNYNIDESTLLGQAGINETGKNSLLLERANNGYSFDWVDAVIKTGIQKNNYVNISGRSEGGLGYNIGVGIQNETGNVKNEKLDKYTIKVGLNHRINDKFSVGLNLTVANTIEELGSPDAMESAFRLSPLMSPYGLDGELTQKPGKLDSADGTFRLIDKTSTANPLVDINEVVNDKKRWNGIGSAFFEYRALDWLSFKTTFSANYDALKQGRYFGDLSIESTNNRSQLSSAEIYQQDRFNYTWDNQFNIDYNFNKNHNVKLLGLQSVFSSKTERAFNRADDFPYFTSYNNLGAAEGATYTIDPSGDFDGLTYESQKLSSYALRFNYSFKNKYLVTLANRWDGSSLLSGDKRWDSFPSVAVGWRVIEEGFMSNQTIFSNLKIRTGYGFTGNNNIDPYSTSTLLTDRNYYDYNSTVAEGWLGVLANDNLGWEKTRELNIGLDFGLFNNRVSGSVDVYDKLSEDLLLKQRLPFETGYEEIVSNIGSVSNKGIEIALNTRNIDTKKITWETSFTFTKNTNKIEKIYEGIDNLLLSGSGGNANYLIEGESINSYYNYKFDGIWQANQVDEADSYGVYSTIANTGKYTAEGNARVADINNDGIIDADNDRVVLGSSDPDWTGSFFTKLRVGNFDVSASVITSQGSFVYSPFHADFLETKQRGRQKLNVKTYIPQNTSGLPYQPSNSYPLARNEGDFWNDSDVGFYRDASFVKVKNIAVGYNFTKDILDKLSIKNLRLYANILNPFVFTDYDGLDPEWADASLKRGGVSSITYQLGLSVKF